jgi:molybdate transport system substrate-binding protein
VRRQFALRFVCDAALVAVLFAQSVAARAQAAPIVAAAANLNFALKDVADAFRRDESAAVEIVFGASGTLTRQIRDGAPFELFLAADEDFPKQLSRKARR